MIDTIALKTSIIDLAVSGKLSPQFQASDSISEIIAALPKVSNKRKKLLEQTFEYGKLPDIPAHWTWIRLGEIASYGDTPTKAFFDDVGGDTWILDLEDIKSGGSLLMKTRVNGKKFAGDKTVFKAGQVLYSKLRPYLKKVLVADEDGISTPELISFDTYGGILPQYIVYCLLSSFTGRAIDKRSYGIKMPRVDAGFMVNLPIPLPPVSEQHFIVGRVLSAFSALDTIDALQAKYADNLAVLKSKLIDAAIQGKLTEQLPEDGTAEELYQQIQAEKQALIKSGKIKKEKPLPPITPDEIPFEIPESWKWARLGDIAESVNVGIVIRPTRYYVPQGQGTPAFRNCNIQQGFIDDGEWVYLTPNAAKENPRAVVKNGDILVARSGSPGNCCVVTERYSGRGAVDIVIVRLRQKLAVPDFMKAVLCSSFAQKAFLGMSRGVALSHLGATAVASLPVPLPPLAEQKRIVSKLQELLPLCEKLK